MAAPERKQFDPAVAIVHCKESIKSSAAWEEVCQSVEQFLLLRISNGLQSFDTLDEAERTALLTKTARELERGGQLDALKTEVKRSLRNAVAQRDQQEGVHVLHSDGGDSEAQARLCGMCQYLLMKWPHLSHRLAQCVLLPLDAELRLLLWNCALSVSGSAAPPQNPVAQRGPVAVSTGLEQRCSDLLSSSSLLSFLLPWEHLMRLLELAAATWMQQEGRGTLEDYELLLLFPFVWTVLKRVRGLSWADLEGSAVPQMLVYLYIRFMRGRPWYLQDLSMPTCHEATTKLLGAVNSLLITADPELHSSLTTSLAPPPSSPSSPSGSSGQFLREFRLLLHPFLKCLFVGLLPLETVCVLLDQQLLSVLFPAYDPLPHLLTCVLLLGRRELLRCRNFDQLKSALTQVLSRLTPRVLLDKVKHHYGNLLKSHVTGSHQVSAPAVENHQLRLQVYHLEELLATQNSHRSTQEVELPRPQEVELPRPQEVSQPRAQVRPGPSEGSGSFSRRSQDNPSPSPRPTPTSTLHHSLVQSTAAAMSQRSTSTTQSRPHPHHIAMATTRRPTVGSAAVSAQSPLSRMPVAPPTAPQEDHSSLATQPLSTYTSGHSTSHSTVPRTVEATPPAVSLATAPPRVMTTNPRTGPESRVVLPSPVIAGSDSLERDRIREFWLHVVTRFSDAADLLFKGTEENTQELLAQIQEHQED